MRNAVQVGVCGTQVRNLNMLDVIVLVCLLLAVIDRPFNPVVDWQNLTSIQ